MSKKKMHSILCVDDNLDTLDLIEVFLFRDFNVYTAENGFEGMKIASELIPSLIITDIMMPVVDGIRLFNDLRKHEATADIPVIAITSFIKKITRKSLLNMGFKAVLSKPVHRLTLLATISSALDIPHLLHSQKPQVTDETSS